MDSPPVRLATYMPSVSLKLPHSKYVCVFVTAGSTQSILLLKHILGRLKKCHSECRRYFPDASVPSKESILKSEQIWNMFFVRKSMESYMLCAYERNTRL
jgi:hypothetical protein